MKRLVLPLIVMAASPIAATAATFAPPAACTAYLTVQSRGCTVSHFYTCEADKPGEQWRADYGADGPFFLSKIDRDAQWLESYEIGPATKEVMDPNPRDPASFSDLLDLGLDTFDFGLTKEGGGKSTIKGFDKTTGKSVVIDGVTLQETEFEYTQTDDEGTVLRHARGIEYISEEWRSFFSGNSEWQMEDGSWVPANTAPVKFLTPGKPGFGSTVPLFECDGQMSLLGLPHSVAKSVATPLGGS